jgi:hypothetical protein
MKKCSVVTFTFTVADEDREQVLSSLGDWFGDVDADLFGGIKETRPATTEEAAEYNDQFGEFDEDYP